MHRSSTRWYAACVSGGTNVISPSSSPSPSSGVLISVEARGMRAAARLSPAVGVLSRSGLASHIATIIRDNACSSLERHALYSVGDTKSSGAAGHACWAWIRYTHRFRSSMPAASVDSGRIESTSSASCSPWTPNRWPTARTSGDAAASTSTGRSGSDTERCSDDTSICVDSSTRSPSSRDVAPTLASVSRTTRANSVTSRSSSARRSSSSGTRFLSEVCASLKKSSSSSSMLRFSLRFLTVAASIAVP